MPSPKRVFFHIGAPKTGTTYLQHVVFQGRRELERQGLLHPLSAPSSVHLFRWFAEAGRRPPTGPDTWERIVERTREWQGSSVLISNERMGVARPERIAEGVAEACAPDAEPHVIFTARDLVRQMTSDWQEQVKHQHTVTLEKFVGDLVDLGLDGPEPFASHFWGMHDAADVLARWEQVVPRENIHVVTVPQPGAPQGELWRRFASVLGIDPDSVSTSTPRSNQSMGVAETEFVRRMNERLQGCYRPGYNAVIRGHLAEEVLGNRSSRVVLPPERRPALVERSEQIVAALADRGYDVVGDLAELLPPDPAEDEVYVSPTELDDADLADAAMRASVALARRATEFRRRLDQPPEPQLPTPTRTQVYKERVRTVVGNNPTLRRLHHRISSR